MNKKFFIIFYCACVVIAAATESSNSKLPPLPAPNPAKAVTAISRFGEPTYEHTKLVNPDAPKGGTLRLATTGTFDVVNNNIVRGLGTCAYGISLTSEPLMFRSPAEPFALYALVAEKVEFSDDKSYVTIYLNPKARFHNGDPVTTADVKATMETLRDKGLPRFKKFYGKIAKVVIHSDQIIQFQLMPDENGIYDRELPLVIVTMPVLSKKQLDTIDFANSSLTPIVGTGAYMLDHVQQGRVISFKRNPNYWGADLPIAKGQFNFDEIRIEYFKNATAHFQAFLAKESDIFFELDPKQWKNGYKVDAVRRGDIIREDLHHDRPVIVRTVIMNMRRPIFHNIELRRALVMAFDADSLNRMVFDGTMNIPHSLFANTQLAHNGPAEGAEKDLLLKHALEIEPKLLQRMLAEPFSPARTNGAGDQRENLKKAADILDAAGFTVKKGKRIAPDGTPIELSIMIKDDRLEKIALSLRESLKALGISLNVRKYDANTYENKVVESDFDLIIHAWANSLSPGTEQGYFFGVKAADIKGSANFIGLKDPVAEALAKEVALAKTYDDLKVRVHALDRYVMHLCVQIPLTYDNTLRFAYWKDKLAIPTISGKFDVNVINRGWDPKLVKAVVVTTEAAAETAEATTTKVATTTATITKVAAETSSSTEPASPTGACGIFCRLKNWIMRLFI